MQNHLLTANTILYCRHWGQAVRFYRDYLRLPVLFEAEWFVEFGLTSTARLSIADEKRASVKSARGKGITLAMEVDDIRAVHVFLQQAGLRPTDIEPHVWQALFFYVFDPEGHRLEIWQIRK
ncbi:MAG: VOC family protein [Thermodesulfobacteriota bacterium]|nr:VOC family protein [Thermodesulfobacteriota bacterium]